jgi:hypothetical protein
VIYADIELPDNMNEDRVNEKDNEDITKNILLTLSNETRA